MIRKGFISLFVTTILLLTAAASMAEVNVNIGVGIPLPPPLVIPAPPDLVVIPNTYVYFAPGIDADLVFYHGLWYRSYGGYWYTARSYRGPWTYVVRERLPRPIIILPGDFRTAYRSYPHIPYGHVHRNWNRWEREKYWEKRKWKHEEREWKRDRRDRRDGRKDMRRDERHGSREQKLEQRHETRHERRDQRQEHRDLRRESRDQRQGMREERREVRQDQRREGKERRKPAGASENRQDGQDNSGPR